MCRSDGLLCAGDKVVETLLTTGKDRTPGAGVATVLLPLKEQLQIRLSDCQTVRLSDCQTVGLSDCQCNVLTSHSEIFNKILLRNSSHDRDILQVSLQEACQGYLDIQISISINVQTLETYGILESVAVRRRQKNNNTDIMTGYH